VLEWKMANTDLDDVGGTLTVDSFFTNVTDVGSLSTLGNEGAFKVYSSGNDVFLRACLCEYSDSQSIFSSKAAGPWAGFNPSGGFKLP
jgi:hypothetical protein